MLCRNLLALLLLFLLLPGLGAQTDLRDRQDFLTAQAPVYQRWLESSGLDQYLQVHDIRVGEDYVSIRLLVPLPAAEEALTAYQSLKETFEATSVLTLEEQLFFKALTVLESPQEQVFVTVRNSYTRRNPFLRSIGYREGELTVKEDNPKAKVTDVKLPVRPLSRGAEPGVAALDTGYDKEAVFGCILAYVNELYTKRDCFEQAPELTVHDSIRLLRFTVRGLCREVIPPDNSLIRSILNRLGLGENWYKRELLDFVIKFDETDHQLYIILEGKFGSGLYASVNEQAYILMETDFDAELEAYTNQFGLQLRDLLQNCH